MRRTDRKARTDRRKRREQIERKRQKKEKHFLATAFIKKRQKKESHWGIYIYLQWHSSINVSSCLFEWLSSLISHAAIAQQVVSITKNGLTSTIPKQLASCYATYPMGKVCKQCNKNIFQNNGKNPLTCCAAL